MSSEVAISVGDVSKCYTIYDRPHDRLKQSVLPRLNRLWGRDGIRYYREFWALRDVSFEVEKGDTFAIIGRNGSGKSTLLQIIAGTVAANEGSVGINGRVAALLELGSGFNPEFTGRENVYLNASLYGLKRTDIDARFDAIAAFADIGSFIDQPVRTYSSGMSVRLAFAVIAHVDADILLIDEALAVGDAFFVQKCMRFLRSFMERGTILFVSHDTAAVVNLCNKAILLEGGRIRERGAPKDVVELYLAQTYEEQQGPHAVAQHQGVNGHTNGGRPAESGERDMRLDFINKTALRNDIEIFAFDPAAAAFGKGGATVTSVVLADEGGTPLSWIVGGEKVSLTVRAAAGSELKRPIIGFIVKDRLGQYLFGDNTYLSYRDTPVAIMSGRVLEARFDFRMPILPPGDYTVTVAVADGTQEDHTQHHWIHDALKITSHSSSVSTGLVGIPIMGIRLALVEAVQ
jgi:lipopolysaccharide transport system ATP-binding protein